MHDILVAVVLHHNGSFYVVIQTVRLGCSKSIIEQGKDSAVANDVCSIDNDNSNKSLTTLT